MKPPSPSTIAIMAGSSLVPQHGVPSSAARFDYFVRQAGAVALTLKPSHGLITCLVAFDAVTSLNELQSILCNLTNARPCGESIFVSWTAHDRQCRKKLSARTTIAIAKLPPDANLGKELDAYLSVLIQHYPCSRSWLSRDVWVNVFEDVQAWLYNILPAYQFGAAYGHWTCKALPDAVQFRESRVIQPLAAFDDRLADSNIEAIALDTAFDKEDEATARPLYLPELKAALAAPFGGDSVRVSDQRWRSSLKEKLDSASHKIGKSGNYIDAILLWWVCYLVTVGSVRLTDPAVTTISKYFQDLANPIIESIMQAAGRTGDEEPPFWDAVFIDLRARISDSSGRAALASFHVFCVESFGVEILPNVVFNNTVVESQVSANVIWPDEFARILEMSRCVDPEERVCATTQVLLAIAGAVPIRIGEVRALHIGDIAIENGVMQIHYCPRGGQHSGKSHAAPRYMRTTDPHAIGIVQAWIQRRMVEVQDDTEFLFGDPNDRRVLYKFGRSVCLLNRLLKAVTGDPTVRFHSFRHSWVNHAILQANESYTGTTGISALQEIATMAGHATVETTLECYFHRMESAVRYSIDRYVDALPMSSAEISGWVGMTSAAVRKGKQRSDDPSNFYVQLLRDHALEVFHPQGACAEPEPDCKLVNGSTVNFSTVMHAMRDLVAGRDESEIYLRTGLGGIQLDQLKAIATDCLNLLDGIAIDLQIRRSIWGAGNGTTPSKATPLVTRLQEFCNFKVGQHLSGLVESLTEMTRPTRDVQEAIQVWLLIKGDGLLDMSDPVSAKPLLTLLQQCGVAASNVVIRIGCKNPGDPHAVAVAKSTMSTVNVLSTCQSVFREMPRVDFVKERTGIPCAYVLLTGSKFGLNERVPPAALSMSGFHTLMFLTAVWSGHCAIVALEDAK